MCVFYNFKCMSLVQGIDITVSSNQTEILYNLLSGQWSVSEGQRDDKIVMTHLPRSRLLASSSSCTCTWLLWVGKNRIGNCHEQVNVQYGTV